MGSGVDRLLYAIIMGRGWGEGGGGGGPWSSKTASPLPWRGQQQPTCAPPADDRAEQSGHMVGTATSGAALDWTPCNMESLPAFWQDKKAKRKGRPYVAFRARVTDSCEPDAAPLNLATIAAVDRTRDCREHDPPEQGNPHAWSLKCDVAPERCRIFMIDFRKLPSTSA